MSEANSSMPGEECESPGCKSVTAVPMGREFGTNLNHAIKLAVGEL